MKPIVILSINSDKEIVKSKGLYFYNVLIVIIVHKN